MKSFRDSWDLEGQALSEIHVEAVTPPLRGAFVGWFSIGKVGEREGIQ